MKIIKLFIASSIVEFKSEREQLGNYVRQLADLYAPRDIYIQLLECEDFSTAVANERKQDEYNDKIRESQYFYVIFGAKAGQYTIEEFNVALEQFKATGAPKLYTYFRTLPEGEKASQDVIDFMERLDKEIGHYYSMFSNLDSVKLNMLIELAKNPELQSNLEFVDSQAVLDGKKILSLENVPLYSKNATVRQLKSAIEKLNEEYAAASALYAKSPGNAEIYKLLSEYSTARADFSKRLHMLEMDILGLFQNVSALNNSDRPLTWRQKKAMELVDAGNYEGALNILRDAQRDQELEQAEEISDAVDKRVHDYIAESRLRIDILKAQGITTESAAEITACYEKAVKLAEKHHIELGILYDYAHFLHDQRQFTYGIEIAQRLRKWYELDGATVLQKAPLLDLLAGLLSGNNQTADAEALYRESLAIRKDLAKRNPGVYERDVALACNNLATLLNEINEKAEAEKLFREALEIVRSLAQRKSVADEPSLALACSNLAIVLKDTDQFEEAERLHREALEIRRRLAQHNPAAYEPYLADTCNNLALLLNDTNQMEEAEKLYREALKICRKLATRNPEAYEPPLAETCHNLAILLQRTQQWAEAEQLFREALGILRKLAKYNAAAYEPDVAFTAGALASLLQKTNQMAEAESLYREALEIYRKWATRNPAAYEPSLARTCNNLANLLSNRNENVEAEKLCREALEIRRRLAQHNPAAYEPNLADTCNDLANILKKANATVEAEKLYREALAIRRKLATRNPVAYASDVATTCNNLASLLKTIGQNAEAEQLYREALKIYRSLSAHNPATYEPYVASIAVNLAGFLNSTCLPSDIFQRSEAEALYCEALKIHEKLATRNPAVYEPTLASTYGLLGVFYVTNYYNTQAEEMFRKALEVRRRLVQRNPKFYEQDMALSAFNLAKLYLLRKHDKASAKPLFEEALAIYEKYPQLAQKAQEVRDFL